MIVSWWRVRKLDPKRTIYNMWEHRGWGNRLEFSNFDLRRISAHLPNRHRFKVGTELREKMQSGHIARFKVIEVEYVSGVHDMLFAKVQDIGYLKQSSQ
jgi:hypothetical protein